MLAVTALVAGALAWWQPDGTTSESAGVAASRVDGIERATSERAYELYLNGKFHRSRRDIDSSELAIESFEAALREDAYFAEAWSALAETHIGSGIQQQRPLASAMDEARKTALRALELEPSLASGHAALAVLVWGYVAWFVPRALRRPFGAFVFVASMIVLIGSVASRVALDAHWFTDVLAGVGLGAAALVLAREATSVPLVRRVWVATVPRGTVSHRSQPG